MKSVLIPFAAVVALSVSGLVFAGTSAEPEAQPSVTVTPIVAPVELKVEPAVCAPAAQKVCESIEVKAEPKDTETPEVKVEVTPDQPIEPATTDNPKQS